MYKKLNNNRLLLLLCIVSLVSALIDFLLLTELTSVAMVLYIAYDLITQRKELFPLGKMALTIAGLQWIISPVISYNSSMQTTYEMLVDESTYLTYTLIGYIAFVAGVYCLSKRNDKKAITISQAKQWCTKHLRSAYLLIFLGLVSYLAPTSSSLGFVFGLMNLLLFVGSVMLMYGRPKISVLVLILVIGFVLVISLSNGMFHNLLVYGLFMILTLFLIKDYSNKSRVLLTLLMLFSVITLQSIKASYRAVTWNSNYQGSKVELFATMFLENITGNAADMDETTEENIVVRFNQGWIIARIYNRIPEHMDYQNGRTIIDAVEASILPRFIATDKKNSGSDSIEDFKTFTGYNLSKGTSMGLSVWGEAYGNFGLFGGAVFMFIWGIIISSIVYLLNSLSRNVGYWIYFAPLIGFNLIKAEINLVSVLNWTVKGFVFTWAVIEIFKVITASRRK